MVVRGDGASGGASGHQPGPSRCSPLRCGAAVPQPARVLTHEGRQVRRLGLVILGEGLHLALAALAALLGEEPQTAVARGLELRQQRSCGMSVSPQRRKSVVAGHRISVRQQASLPRNRRQRREKRRRWAMAAPGQAPCGVPASCTLPAACCCMPRAETGLLGDGGTG